MPTPAIHHEASRMPKVLIVDDHQGTRETLALLLRTDGFQTAIAASGREAVAMTLQDDFDVILIDLRLPDALGTDVVRDLRHRGVRSRIVVVTAFPEIDSSFDAGCAGADGFVDGPLWGDEVSRVVRQAVDGPWPVRHPTRIGDDAQRIPNSSASGIEPSGIDGRIRTVLQMIEADPAASVATLAGAVGLSEPGLRHLFSANVHLSLSHFIVERRLDLTARLLRETCEPISTVARLAGAGDLHHFREIFRNRFGMSMQAYRRRFFALTHPFVGGFPPKEPGNTP